MKIELLYFDGCPSWEEGLKNLEAALKEEGVTSSVDRIKVNDDDEANHLKFLGSPSFRVDQQDLWHEERDTYSLSCRIYSTPDGIKGWPTVEMLRTRLRSFVG
ncbi:MAG: hypothetical protein JNM55_09700 [Anaerolineales bacterium]|jgi:hypothetical protein|nr:hypothetical protein [Anaerolineales bacterium]